MRCPRCKMETVTESEKSEIIIKCPTCGWFAVTTYMSEIDDDIKKYSIIIAPNNSIDKDLIKLVSEISGMNVLESRNLLINGGVMIKEYAVKIKEIAIMLDIAGIIYHIDPEFPYLE